MHYICSDIHGQYGMFLTMLELIRFGEEDHLYIIGDAVDRGPAPITLLRDIKNRPNVTFMIGNHEHMMLETIKSQKREDLSLWIYNGGETTLRQYGALPRSDRAELVSWLRERPLVIPSLKVAGRQYYLAHASHTLYPEKNVLRYCDAAADDIEQVVWSRDYRNPAGGKLHFRYRELYGRYPETTLIMGHSMVFMCSYGIVTKDGFCRISRSRSGHLINTDCGCAAAVTLGCLRLEDGHEFYVDNKPLSPSIMRWRSEQRAQLSRQ